MASPGTIASVGLGGNIAGMFTSMFGNVAQGEAKGEMYDYQAGIASLNAQIAKQNEDLAINTGEQEAQAYGLQASQRFGQIKVAQGSGGLDVNSGSDKDVQDSQRLVTSMDLNQIRSNANKTAYNYAVESVQYTAQAQLDRMAGQNERSAGMINAASSFLGGTSSIASKWLQGNQMGLWGTV